MCQNRVFPHKDLKKLFFIWREKKTKRAKNTKLLLLGSCEILHRLENVGLTQNVCE